MPTYEIHVLAFASCTHIKAYFTGDATSVIVPIDLDPGLSHPSIKEDGAGL